MKRGKEEECLWLKIKNLGIFLLGFFGKYLEKREPRVGSRISDRYPNNMSLFLKNVILQSDAKGNFGRSRPLAIHSHRTIQTKRDFLMTG